MKNLLSVAELAHLLGVAKQTVYNRHFSGQDLPPAIKIGSRLLFDPVDVQAWVDAKKRPLASLVTSATTAAPRRPGRPTKAEQVAGRKAPPTTFPCLGSGVVRH